jgi:hypothetical protein
LPIISKEMEKNDATFITIFRLKKCNFHYDFLFRKVLFSLR